MGGKKLGGINTVFFVQTGSRLEHLTRRWYLPTISKATKLLPLFSEALATSVSVWWLVQVGVGARTGLVPTFGSDADGVMVRYPS